MEKIFIDLYYPYRAISQVVRHYYNHFYDVSVYIISRSFVTQSHTFIFASVNYSTINNEVVYKYAPCHKQTRLPESVRDTLLLEIIYTVLLDAEMSAVKLAINVRVRLLYIQ